MKTLYEIHWHSFGNRFSHCTVTPIRVEREGVLPGCSGVSITAIGSDGRRFLGNPDNYYATEADAWAEVKANLKDTAEGLRQEQAAISKDLAAIETYLGTLL